MSLDVGMTDGTKGGAQRTSSLRPGCVGEVDPETATHICLSIWPKRIDLDMEIIETRGIGE
jgi:hypothetical protein